MPLLVRYTYDYVTPESAADGDCAERGWYVPGGWHYPLHDQQASEPFEMRASVALEDVQEVLSGIESIENNGDSLTVYGGSEQLYDRRECIEESRAAHLTGHPRLLAAFERALRAAARRCKY
jgi:hypothetical protein